MRHGGQSRCGHLSVGVVHLYLSDEVQQSGILHHVLRQAVDLVFGGQITADQLADGVTASSLARWSYSCLLYTSALAQFRNIFLREIHPGGQMGLQGRQSIFLGRYLPGQRTVQGLSLIHICVG